MVTTGTSLEVNLLSGSEETWNKQNGLGLVYANYNLNDYS